MSTAVLAKRMKIWERRLMKDFHVAPVEQPDEPEVTEGAAAAVSTETPLDRFRRVSKQVASQSATIKWNEVIRGATIEANSQIGRCRNRDSFKNQQNLLKAMEQARRLIERSPIAQSPCHAVQYDCLDQTNQTLVQLLKNISEEINEISPQNTLRVSGPGYRSVTPLQSLNNQLQTLLTKTPSPYQTMNKTKQRSVSPRPPARSASGDDSSSPPSRTSPPLSKSPPKPKSETPKVPFRVEAPKSPLSKPSSILKNRSPTPDSSKSLDNKSLDSVNSVIPVIEVHEVHEVSSPPEKPETPKLIELSDAKRDDSPLKQSPGSPVKVVKRKAPAPAPATPPNQDIAVSRPTAPKIQSNQGMIPPPPETPKVMQIPVLSTTPATPLLPQKPLTLTINEPTCDVSESSPKPSKMETTETPVPALIAPESTGPYSSTERLMTNDAASSTNRATATPSPVCLRAINKIEDVKTIKRQPKTGWI